LLVDRLTRPALGQRGFAGAEILRHWPDIVGPELAALACPLHLKTERGDRAGAALMLRVASGAAAATLHMKAPQIIARVNRYLGYAAVARLKITPGPLPPSLRPLPDSLPAPSAATVREVEAAVDKIASEPVRSALLRLGLALRRGAAIAFAGLVLATGLHAPARAYTVGDFGHDLDTVFGELLDVVPRGFSGIRLGVGPAFDRRFDGDPNPYLHPEPLISLHYKNVIAVDNNQLRFNLLGNWGSFTPGGPQSPWSAGPALRVDFGREQSYSGKLVGLGDVGTGIEVGGFVAYQAGPVRVRAQLLRDVADATNGLLAIGDAGMRLYTGERWTLSGAVKVTWADSKYMNAYFGVTPEQSLYSGLPVYRAHAGLHDITATTVAEYDWTVHWETLVSFGYMRLLTSAADGPLVRLRGSADQPIGAVFAVYAF
jgi:outer membrane scaffolding protein for murein synthesis (MipA/OmpV family)